jgi:hypothetical protein
MTIFENRVLLVNIFNHVTPLGINSMLSFMTSILIKSPTPVQYKNYKLSIQIDAYNDRVLLRNISSLSNSLYDSIYAELNLDNHIACSYFYEISLLTIGNFISFPMVYQLYAMLCCMLLPSSNEIEWSDPFEPL